LLPFLHVITLLVQESDNIEEALDEFDGEYDEEELRLMRIKFINEVAN